MSLSHRLEKSHFWKGGRIIDKDGYILVLVPVHPFANQNGYVREHRLVVEKYIGRYLTPDEVVHHINHKKDDNRIENLRLYVSSSLHLKDEWKNKERKMTRWNKKHESKAI